MKTMEADDTMVDRYNSLSKARHTQTDSSVANMFPSTFQLATRISLCVFSPPTVGKTVCGRLAFEKSVG